MESFAKVLEFIGKFAWALFVTVAFVLFVPGDVAKDIGIYELRTTFKGILWISLVLTVILTIGSAFQYIDKRLIDPWLKRRQALRDQAETRDRELRDKQEADVQNQLRKQSEDRQAAEVLALRIASLDVGERLWIKYCLFYNVQTLSASRSNCTAQSLHDKKIVTEGSGQISNLPFHFRDCVWRYLLEHKDDFISGNERDDVRFRAQLETFRKSLWARF